MAVGKEFYIKFVISKTTFGYICLFSDPVKLIDNVWVIMYVNIQWLLTVVCV